MKNRTSPRRVADRKRAIAAVALRSQGQTYQEIADQLDYHDRAAAYRAVVGMLESEAHDEVEQLRSEGEARYLDLILRYHGILEDETTSTADKLKALDGIRKAQDSINRLFGLNREPSSGEAVVDARTVVYADTLPNPTLEALGLEHYVVEHPPIIDVDVD